MTELRLENSPIVYYVSGNEHAEWLLFLHAAFVDHRMFHAQVEYFKGRFNVLTLDIIGHGKSTGAKKGDSINKMSKWIREILKAQDIPQIHIIGVSLGAVLAQDFANRYPEAVKSLACFGGYDINHFEEELRKKNTAAQMAMMMKAVFSVKWFAKANQKISAYTPQAQRDFYEMNVCFPKKSFKYLASLNSMINTCRTGTREYPLLIGCGEHDMPMELSAVKMWAAGEPGCKVAVIENAGHCVNMDNPQGFHLALESFWRGE